MPLSFSIAWRFLFRSRTDRPLTLFTIISILGITLSVTLFLLIDTVMNGFSIRLKETLVGFDAPVTAELSSSQRAGFDDKLKAFVSQHGEFALRTIRSHEFYGLLQQDEEAPIGIKARSVDAEFFDLKKKQIQIYWQDGFDLERFLSSPNAVLVGEEIYKNIPYPYGEDVAVKIIHPFADLGPSGELEPQTKDFVIAGIIATGYYEIDNLYVFVPELALDGFANRELMTLSYFFSPKKLDQADALKESWLKEHPQFKGHVQTWYEKNHALFKAMSLEKIVFFVLFLLLVVISCLNLASVIRIFGMSKLKDVAILRSLGASLAELRQIHWGIGLILGAIGGVVGVSLGLGVIWMFQTFHFSLPDVYEFSELPLRVNPLTVIFLVILAPVFAALVSYLPARRIVRQTVSEVLRMV